MKRNALIVTLSSVIGIVVVTITALLTGHDDMLVTFSMSSLFGIGGFAVKGIGEKYGKR